MNEAQTKVNAMMSCMFIELGFSFAGGQNKKGNTIRYKIIFAHKIKVPELLKRGRVFLTS